MSSHDDKPIVLTLHAKDRLILRGATADELVEAVRKGQWAPAKRGQVARAPTV